MDFSTIKVDIDDRCVANIMLAKPERRNAYDHTMLDELNSALLAFESDRRIRVVALGGSGEHFQGGADLASLKETLAGGEEPNRRFADLTVETMRRLSRCQVPTVALVQGACLGGALGLVASCDYVVATESSFFGLPETRVGLTAASILPQLISAIGPRQTKAIALLGERFDSLDAKRIGLVHAICPAADLESTGKRVIDSLLRGAPEASRVTKQLISELAQLQSSDLMFRSVAKSAADARRSAEVTEGLQSFLQRRDPAWYPGESV